MTFSVYGVYGLDCRDGLTIPESSDRSAACKAASGTITTYSANRGDKIEDGDIWFKLGDHERFARVAEQRPSCTPAQ
jgi:hypothetical protein